MKTWDLRLCVILLIAMQMIADCHKSAAVPLQSEETLQTQSNIVISKKQDHIISENSSPLNIMLYFWQSASLMLNWMTESAVTLIPAQPWPSLIISIKIPLRACLEEISEFLWASYHFHSCHSNPTVRHESCWIVCISAGESVCDPLRSKFWLISSTNKRTKRLQKYSHHKSQLGGRNVPGFT